MEFHDDSTVEPRRPHRAVPARPRARRKLLRQFVQLHLRTRSTTYADTTLDYLAYTRGSNDQYDQWATLTGDKGWAWKNLEPYYMKVRPGRS